jgi:hypothetical protein
MKCILHNKELNYLYRSPGDIRIVKSWWLWWGGLSSWMGRQSVHVFVWETSWRVGHWKTKNEWTYITNVKYGWNWLEIAPNGRLLWERQWNFGSIVVQRSDFHLKKGCAPYSFLHFRDVSAGNWKRAVQDGAVSLIEALEHRRGITRLYAPPPPHKSRC